MTSTQFIVKNGILLSCKGNIDTDIINIPEGIVAIGDNVFNKGCQAERVKSLCIPSSLQSIGDSAFSGFSSLEEIIVSPSNNFFFVNNNCLIEKNTNTLVFSTVNCESIPECEIIANWGACNIHTNATIEIPKTVTVIGKNAFRGANIFNIVFPENAPEIGNYALADCHNLKFVTLPKNLKIIPAHMFCNDESLHFIDLPDKLEIIDHCAFYNCALFSLTIPKSVSYISDSIVGDKHSDFHIETVTFEDTNGWYLCSRAESYEVALTAIRDNESISYSALAAKGTPIDLHIVPIYVENVYYNAKLISWSDMKYLVKH